MTRIQYVSCSTKTITTSFKQEWKLFALGTQTFWTCSKLSYWPAEAIRTRRTLFELIVIVIVIARMTRNDHQWSLEQTRIVNSWVDSAQWNWGIRNGRKVLRWWPQFLQLLIRFGPYCTVQPDPIDPLFLKKKSMCLSHLVPEIRWHKVGLI